MKGSGEWVASFFALLLLGAGAFALGFNAGATAVERRQHDRLCETRLAHATASDSLRLHRVMGCDLAKGETPHG